MDSGKLYLGIDYGGNAVKMGIVDELGSLIGRRSIPTGPETSLANRQDCRAFTSKVTDFVHSMGLYGSELGGVGIAIPGVIKEDVFLTPNVKADWSSLIQELEKTFVNCPVAVLNDANAAALGELWKGAGARYRSVLLVTLGSAIGAGLVVDGNIVSGGHGAAGEVGHLTVVPGGRSCKCGRNGCVERYASARGLVQSFHEAESLGKLNKKDFGTIQPAHETDALAVFEAARLGDPRGLYAVEDMAEKLGYALAQVACVADPSVILLGGGLSQASDLFIDAVREYFKRFAFSACHDTEILCANLLGDAGVIGAARYSMLVGDKDSPKPRIF